MKLRTKILTLFITLFTCGFLFLLITTSSAIRQSHQFVVDSFINQTFESKSQEINSWLDQRIIELRMISQSFKDENIEKHIPYITSLNENIGKQYGNSWGTFAIGYTDGIGWVNKDMTIDISKRDYFKHAMQCDEEYILSAPVISKTDEALISLICYPLRNDKNEIYGFLNAAISLEHLHTIVDQIDFYNHKSWIMDSHGSIYTKTDIDDTTLSSLTSHFNQNGIFKYEKDNKEYTLFYTRINSTKNWYLCTSVESALLTKDTNDLMMKLTFIYIIVIIIMIFSCTLLSRSVTEPIQELSDIMHKAEQGDLSVRSQYKGKDEIAFLSSTFNKMIQRIQKLMNQVIIDEKEKREAELRVLQAQINPHFLYNTLDTLQWKAYEVGNNEIVSIIESLSQFFRISLSNGKEFIPIEKEIEHVESYLKIQQIRFSDILSYDFDIQIKDSVHVLKLFLQPLVENSIKHGIRPKLTPGHIHIRILQDETKYIFEVEDNGIGISKEKLNKINDEFLKQTPQESYGLINIHKRMKLVYGDLAKIEIISIEDKGTLVRIIIETKKGDHV